MIMENHPDPSVSDPHQELVSQTTKKGGLITMPFIIANEALERVASYGLLANMILYLIGSFYLGVAKSSNIVFLWSAATNFMPLIGAFISDSYLGRFLTIGLGSITTFLGIVLIWLTAMIPQTRPPPCNPFTEKCKPPTSSQYALLLASMTLMSIGAGGVRPCSLAFGADQLDKRTGNNSNNQTVLETFFSWYYASAAFATLVAFTGIAYIQENAGWKIGFGVPAILMFLSALLFFLASPFYIKQKPNKSLFTGLAQVIVAAYKNRKLAFPPEDSEGWYHHGKGVTPMKLTKKLRFLNKACIIRRPEEIKPDGSSLHPWRLCTVEQTEELKALVRIIPLWSSSIAMSINVSQGTFQVLQAKSMNRHITSGFVFPAASFFMFLIVSIVIWLIVYDRVIIPLGSKLRGKPFKIDPRVRMGMGLVCSAVAMAVAAIVEHMRKRRAINEGYINNPEAIVNMTAMWLVPQNILNGIAEALNAVAQNEFFYSELPKSMSSIAASMSGLGLAVGSLLASLILNIVSDITRKNGEQGWITDDINKGSFDNYYWLLTVLSFINMFYFLYCNWAYGHSSSDQSETSAGGYEIHDAMAETKKKNEDELLVYTNNKIENGAGKEEEEVLKGGLINL
ncbi:protein NRT1/ PTR FAMILY 1.2-like [Impatiens glandulifera]|uniref:protein NRT1/ PTR FAMILY 1.2-like n=1 Tax=Impatiens glandulifera TaxID=253017 RepID=UPI001FB0CC9A|nr:protein NRT1/ PTR FAMILY 1.2-like [Impatiens glandulifera]